MKHGRINWTFIFLLSVISVGAFGQPAESNESEKRKVPRWVSEKGYWVIEGNMNLPMDHIIRFYNTENVLVYKETLKGIRLKPDKTKVKMKLKRILETSVLAWERKKQVREELALVKSVL